MRNAIFFLTICTIISCKQQPNQSKNSLEQFYQVRDSLTDELNQIYSRGHIYGFSVAIVNQSETIYQNGFGFSDLQNNKEYNENSIQNIASISKTLIGISLLKAQELGKLNLDDSISKYLSFDITNPYYPDSPITIRQLATHTSTIIDTKYYDEKAYVLKEEKFIDIEGLSETLNQPDMKIAMTDFLRAILQKEGEWYQKDGFLKKKPGEQFEYSNIGASLAALVLERATGKSYESFTTEHILKPLKMSNSGWSFEDVNMYNHSKLYTKNETELPYYSLITFPDGGFITSANDLGLYLTELIKGKLGEGTILSHKSYRELFTLQLDETHFDERDKEDKYNDEYNSGIFMGFGGDGNIGHTGFDPGVATLMFFNPKTNVGKLLIINTTITSMDGLKEFYAIMDKLGEYEKKLNQ
ncbi:serine hydrolase [uncultured Psychroserpens sp.]|uniref:serine hydrolase domain-containing protein n=1 Tax=uncultured Psychroserpens sp. TaxID=255436 RepID=UPI002637548C|nr:serine hydrolase domain-containing protein [uncultured Psychroserpens sp.]